MWVCDTSLVRANRRAAEIAQVAGHQGHHARRRKRQHSCACGDEQGNTLGWQRLTPKVAVWREAYRPTTLIEFRVPLPFALLPGDERVHHRDYDSSSHAS